MAGQTPNRKYKNYQTVQTLNVESLWLLEGSILRDKRLRKE